MPVKVQLRRRHDVFRLVEPQQLDNIHYSLTALLLKVEAISRGLVRIFNHSSDTKQKTRKLFVF